MVSTVALKFRRSVSLVPKQYSDNCLFNFCPVLVTVSDIEMPFKYVRRGCLASMQIRLPVIPEGLTIRRFGVTDEKEFIEKAV